MLDPGSGKEGGPSYPIHGPRPISLCLRAETLTRNGEMKMQTRHMIMIKIDGKRPGV